MDIFQNKIHQSILLIMENRLMCFLEHNYFTSYYIIVIFTKNKNQSSRNDSNMICAHIYVGKTSETDDRLIFYQTLLKNFCMYILEITKSKVNKKKQLKSLKLLFSPSYDAIIKNLFTCTRTIYQS